MRVHCLADVLGTVSSCRVERSVWMLWSRVPVSWVEGLPMGRMDGMQLVVSGAGECNYERYGAGANSYQRGLHAHKCVCSGHPLPQDFPRNAVSN